MASIKGIQLKAIKAGIGHDLAGFQANLYLNNKKIGTVLDDGYGGELQFHFVNSEEDFDKVANIYKKEIKEKLLSAREVLIYDLLDLSDYEKDFKKAIKQGYTYILHMDYRPRNADGELKIDVPVPYPSQETYRCSKESHLNDLLEEKKPSKHNVYRSLNDFVLS